MIDQISPFIRATLMRGADGELVAPDYILKTVSAAYQQFFVMREAHINRIAVYAAVLGLISGNPPYQTSELEAHGLGHIANFNTYKAHANYEKGAQSYWNLVNSVEVLVKVVLAGNYPKATEYAEIIARNFSDALKEWEDFAINFNLIGSQLTLYGLCPVFFPHEESPMWEVIDVSRFYIPSQTQSYLSKLSNFSVETTYTVQQLFRIYEKATDGGPWNKEALASFLIFRANTILPQTQPFATIMDVQRVVDNNDALINLYYTDTVKLVNMFQKEYTGKISHMIFSYDMWQAVQSSGTSTEMDFLYFKGNKYDRLDEAMLLFTSSPGEWTVHGNKGLGQKMFAQAQAVNMMDCNIVDMVKMSGTPLIRSLATGGRNAEPIRFYPGVVTDIGAAEFVQNNIGNNIQQTLIASQYFNQGIDVNMINSGEDPGLPDRAQGSLSPTEAKQKAYKEFGVLKNNVAHFYNVLDKVYRLTFIRFLTVKSGVPGYEIAKEFKERCIADGVPEELLDTSPKGLYGLPKQFRKVAAARVAGDGSTLGRIMGLETFSQFGMPATLNPEQMTAFKKEVTAASLGVDYIPTFVSPDSQKLTNGATEARLEDNCMKLGLAPLFSPDNDQEAHADEHVGTGAETVKAVAQQQMSPVDAEKIMALLIPHIGEHMEFMSKAPMFYKDAIGKLKDPYRQLVQWAQLNRKNAEAMIQAALAKQQKEAAATEQVMSDAERKDFTAKRDAERSDFKVGQQVERAKDANENRAEVMKEKVYADTDVKRLKVQLDASTAKEKTQAELLAKPNAVLREDLNKMLGDTPSTVDFE